MVKRQINFRLPPILLERIADQAKKEHRNRTNMLEELAIRGLELTKEREEAVKKEKTA